MLTCQWPKCGCRNVLFITGKVIVAETPGGSGRKPQLPDVELLSLGVAEHLTRGEALKTIWDPLCPRMPPRDVSLCSPASWLPQAHPLRI